MNVKKYFSIIATAFALLAIGAGACKKDSTKDKANLGGTLNIMDGFRKYLAPGETMVIYPYGVTHPLGKDLGLYFKTSVMKKYDTAYFASKTDPRYSPMPVSHHSANITVSAPDSLDSFSLYVYVYASDEENYWTSNTSAIFTVVDPIKSIPEINLSDKLQSYKDPRDGTTYNYVSADGLDWMTRNLSFRGSDGSVCGIPYMGCEVMRPIFGSFYTWEEAREACPEDWRLPTCGEWDSISKGGAGSMMTDAHFNGKKMWEFWPEVPIRNTTGMSIIPTGYCSGGEDNEFFGLNSYSCFWSGDISSENSSQALYRYIYLKENDLKTASADRSAVLLSVRCVRDSKETK